MPATNTPRRLRGSLSSAEILAAAESTAVAGGYVSIRNVAQRLRCSPMAIYKYFPSRAKLVANLADRELAKIVASPAETWQTELQNLARTHSDVLAAKPWLLPLLFENPAPGQAAMKLGEQYLGIITKSGMNPEECVSAFTGLLALIYGRGAFTAGREKKELVEPGRDLPQTSAGFIYLTRYDTAENFNNILDIFIAGIEARSRR